MRSILFRCCWLLGIMALFMALPTTGTAQIQQLRLRSISKPVVDRDRPLPPVNQAGPEHPDTVPTAGAFALEVYNDPNYTGRMCYSESEMSANIHAVCNDLVSSLLLQSGWSVRFFRDPNQTGPSKCMTASDPDFSNDTFTDGSALNDSISSFVLYHQTTCPQVPTSALEVYNDAGYTGVSCYSASPITANIHSTCNDKISSVLLQAGWSVRFYRDQNQTGPSKCVTTSDPDFANDSFTGGSALNDAVSSFVLYQQATCPSPVTPAPTPTPPAPGPCNVPFFWQADPAWQNAPLRSCSAPCDKIGPCGCTLTSAAMIFRFYGANVTPASLSSCMGNKACPFYWGTGASCSGGKAGLVGTYGFSWSQLDYQVNQKGRPVILGMERGGVPHWVVVVRGNGSSPANYTINDPAFKYGAGMKLSSRVGWTFTRIAVYDGQKPCALSSTAAQLNINGSPLAAWTTPQQVEVPAAEQDDKVITASGVTGSALIVSTTDVTMTLELSAQSSSGTITDMLIWSDTIDNTSWQAFTPYVELPISEYVFVRFRDQQGNESETKTATMSPVVGPPSPRLETYMPIARQ